MTVCARVCALCVKITNTLRQTSSTHLAPVMPFDARLRYLSVRLSRSAGARVAIPSSPSALEPRFNPSSVVLVRSAAANAGASAKHKANDKWENIYKQHALIRT